MIILYQQYHMPPARPSFTRFWKDNDRRSRVTTPAFFSGAGAAAGTFGGAPAMGTVVSEAERRRPPLTRSKEKERRMFSLAASLPAYDFFEPVHINRCSSDMSCRGNTSFCRHT
mgnify:CR=1 FL=1